MEDTKKINIFETSDKLLYSNGTNVISSINDIQISFLQRSLNLRTNEEEIREVTKIILTHIEAKHLMENLEEHLNKYSENNKDLEEKQ